VVEVEKKVLADEIRGKLRRIAEFLDLEYESPYRIEGAEIDVVWFQTLPSPIGRIPIVGFEIETGKRMSKHIKGDVFNLLSLSPAIGVIIFIKRGYDDVRKWEGNKKGATKFAEAVKGFSRIKVWSEEDVEKLVKYARIQVTMSKT